MTANTTESASLAPGAAWRTRLSRAFGDTRRDLAFWAVCAIAAACFLNATRVTLDDAYIYFRVAGNMAATGLPVYNTGDDFNLTTSPAWLLILTAAVKALGLGALPAVAKALFVACLIVAARLLFLLLRPRAPLMAVFASIPVMFMPSMPGLAGHDTAVALMSGLGLIWSFERRSRMFPLWAAAFFLARAEGALLGMALSCWLGIEALAKGKVIALARTMFVPTAIGAAIIAAWFLFYHHAFGVWLPDTFAIKRLQGISGWTTFAQAWPEHVKAIYDPARPLVLNALTCVLGALGLFAIARACAILPAWAALHYAAYASLGVAYYHWYFYPIEFTAVLCVLAGAAWVIELAARRLPAEIGGRAQAPVAAAALAMVAMALTPALRTGLASFTGARFIDARYDAYVTLARFIASRPRSDGAPTTVLSHEIGVMGYMLPRASFRDVVGLATPARERSDLWNWNRVVQAYPPDLVLWPFAPPPLLVFGSNDARFAAFEPVFHSENGTQYTLYAAVTAPDAPLAAAFLEDKETMAAMADKAKTLAPVSAFVVDERVVLFAHAPSEMTVTAPAGARVMALGFGFRPDAWAENNKPGPAIFRVRSAKGGALLFERTLDPVNAVSDRAMQTAQVILPPGVGNLVLTVEPSSGKADWEWTYWAPPRFRVGADWVGAMYGGPPPCPTMSAVSKGLTDAAAGSLDEASVADIVVSVRGWAADLAAKKPAQAIVVALNDIVVGCAPIAILRPDVVDAQGGASLLQSGFDARITAIGRSKARGAKIRVFADLGEGRYALVGAR